MIDNLYPDTGNNRNNNASEIKTDISQLQAAVSEIYQKLYELTVRVETGTVNANIGNFGLLN
jgi:peptidoglycan hydrolase CwlO-like protein